VHRTERGSKIAQPPDLYAYHVHAATQGWVVLSIDDKKVTYLGTFYMGLRSHNFESFSQVPVDFSLPWLVHVVVPRQKGPSYLKHKAE
jgi:hypothetical protein